MARTIATATLRSIQEDEYVDYIREHVDLNDIESIAASAEMLRALANNRTVVVSALNRRIEDFFSTGSIPSAQTLLLGRGNDFYVRANIWPATSDMASGRTYQDQFAYNLAHDHNFSFLTVCALGPGYETEIYEYDYEKVQGYVGEQVDLRFLEKVKFGSGLVMLYRASKDVHIQYPPEELTITLNLMVANPEVRLRDQFCFDLPTNTISGYPAELATTGRASLLSIAGRVGDGDTEGLLQDLSARHPCRRTRLAAFEALHSHSPADAQSIWERAAKDPSPLVSTAARQKLQQLGNA